MAKSNDGHPWRNWKITLVAMDGEKEVKGKLSILLDHVEYILHPTFEEPRRGMNRHIDNEMESLTITAAKKEEPYILQEKGWGEFDMRVVLYFTDNVADPQVLLFDLNFALSNYSKTHTIEFPNASPELLKLLATTPRKGGKKPMSSAPPLKSEKESKPSTSTSSSSQVAKKKPISSSPNAKVSKKSKAESKSTSFSSTASSVTSTKRADKSSQKPSLSSPSLPLARSPSFTDLSPMESSLYSSPAQTNTPESIRAKEEQEVGEVISDMNDDRGEHVYKMSDVYNLNPIHHATLDQSVRDKWNIPQVK
jgi:transcription initiation factor IIF auxiliary subunit